MLSSVLRSKRAVQVNIQIMRTFVRLRQMLVDNEQLARKLAILEGKYDCGWGPGLALPHGGQVLQMGACGWGPGLALPHMLFQDLTPIILFCRRPAPGPN
jgi:mannitol/fructose-specific phosphotransferase system IIA component (Ntr-type)